MFGANYFGQPYPGQGYAKAGNSYTKSLTAVLSFTGAIARNTGKKVSGSLSFTGVISRAIGKKVSGTLSFTGTIMRALSRGFTGSLGFVGSVGNTVNYLKSLTATLSFSGLLSAVHFGLPPVWKYLTTSLIGGSKSATDRGASADKSLSSDSNIATDTGGDTIRDVKGASDDTTIEGGTKTTET